MTDGREASRTTTRTTAASAWGLPILGAALLLGIAFSAGGQELSGRFGLEADWEPLSGFFLTDPDAGTVNPFPPESEAKPGVWGLTAQLDVSVQYPAIGTDNTFVFTGLGLGLAWLSWEANFPRVEEPQATPKRTFRRNDFIQVLRTFPSVARPGETFEMTILIEALQDLPPGVEVTVQEELPSGWLIDPIEPEATRLSREAARWRVELGAAGSRDTIRYLASVPTDAAVGRVAIEGRVQSDLFPDLDLSDTLEVIEEPPTLPGRIRVRQDVIFAQRVSGGMLLDPIAFRTANLRVEALLQPGLRLTNFLTLQNVGTQQTPSFRWRDTVTVQGQTSGGVSTRLSLRFRGEEDLRMLFDRGSLQIGALPLLPDVALRLRAGFDVSRVSELRLSLNHVRPVANALGRVTLDVALRDDLTLEVLSLSVRLSSRIDGIFLVDDRYGPLRFDGDDDGVEETHLALVRRQVQLRFAIDKLDVRWTTLFRPVLDDVDSDGARERISRGKLVRQEIRVRRSLKDVVFQGHLLLAEDDPTAPVATLSPARVRLGATVLRPGLRLSAQMTLELRPLRLETTFGFALSF